MTIINIHRTEKLGKKNNGNSRIKISTIKIKILLKENWQGRRVTEQVWWPRASGASLDPSSSGQA